MRRSALFFGLGLVVSLLTSSSARAQESEAPIALGVPDDCRDEAIALARKELAPEASWKSARLAVERAGEGYRATVETALGTRRLEGESCAAAVRAGLVFVLLSASEQHVEPAPPSAAEALAEPTPPAAPFAASSGLSSPVGARSLMREDRPAAAPIRVRRALALRASGSGILAAGALPGSGLGAGVRASLGSGAWHGGAGFSGFAERHVASSVHGAGGRFWLWSGSAQGCVARPRGFFRPGGCVGVELGRMHGEATGVQERHHARAMWGAAFAELDLALPIYRGVSLLFSAQPEVALVRRRFRLEGAGVVHQPARFSFSASLGVAYEFSLAR